MSQGIKEWNRKQWRLLLVLMFSTQAVSWAYILLPYVVPLSLLLVGAQVLLTGISIALLARFVLRQRAEYWRERGKDPKHPHL